MKSWWASHPIWINFHWLLNFLRFRNQNHLLIRKHVWITYARPNINLQLQTTLERSKCNFSNLIARFLSFVKDAKTTDFVLSLNADTVKASFVTIAWLKLPKGQFNGVLIFLVKQIFWNQRLLWFNLQSFKLLNHLVYSSTKLKTSLIDANLSETSFSKMSISLKALASIVTNLLNSWVGHSQHRSLRQMKPGSMLMKKCQFSITSSMHI